MSCRSSTSCSTKPKPNIMSARDSSRFPHARYASASTDVPPFSMLIFRMSCISVFCRMSCCSRLLHCPACIQSMLSKTLGYLSLLYSDSIMLISSYICFSCSFAGSIGFPSSLCLSLLLNCSFSAMVISGLSSCLYTGIAWNRRKLTECRQFFCLLLPELYSLSIRFSWPDICLQNSGFRQSFLPLI